MSIANQTITGKWCQHPIVRATLGIWPRIRMTSIYVGSFAINMEISQLIDAEQSLRGPQLQTKCQTKDDKQSRGIQKLFFSAACSLRTLTVGWGWKELLSYFKAEGNLHGLWSAVMNLRLRKGLIGGHTGKVEEGRGVALGFHCAIEFIEAFIYLRVEVCI